MLRKLLWLPLLVGCILQAEELNWRSGKLVKLGSGPGVYLAFQPESGPALPLEKAPGLEEALGKPLWVQVVEIKPGPGRLGLWRIVQLETTQPPLLKQRP